MNFTDEELESFRNKVRRNLNLYDEQRTKLLRHFAVLNEDARSVLVALAAFLEKEQRDHGALVMPRDPRDWSVEHRSELLNELLDTMVSELAKQKDDPTASGRARRTHGCAPPDTATPCKSTLDALDYGLCL